MTSSFGHVASMQFSDQTLFSEAVTGSNWRSHQLTSMVKLYPQWNFKFHSISRSWKNWRSWHFFKLKLNFKWYEVQLSECQKVLLTLPKFHKKFPIRSGVIKIFCRRYKFENKNVFGPWFIFLWFKRSFVFIY